MVILLALGMLGLILDSRRAMFGAAEGVELCLTAVIPSLLPFLFLSMLLTDRLWGRNNRFLRPLGRLFRLPDGSEALLIPGLLGGYPAGAACVGRAWAQGKITKGDAQRLLGFCSNPGPAFIFGIVGTQFSSLLAPWALWGLVLLGAVTAAQLLPSCEKEIRVTGGGGDIPAQVSQVLGNICVLVILFRTGLYFLASYFPLDGTVLVVLQGLLELTNGCCGLLNVTSEEARFLLAAAFLSMGGLCVGLQTRQVTRGLSLKYYCLGKLIQTVTAVFGGWVLLSRSWGWPALAGGMVLLWKKFGKKVAFFKESLYTVGKKDSRRRVCFSERK